MCHSFENLNSGECGLMWGMWFNVENVDNPGELVKDSRLAGCSAHIPHINLIPHIIYRIPFRMD